MWGCVWTPPSGCFTLNCISETNNSQRKAVYTFVSTIFHYVQMFFEYQYIVLYKVEGTWILWKGEGISWDVFRHFDWLTFVDHQRKNRQNCGNYTCVKSSQFLKYHRSVTKQTNPLKVDNLITNKSVTIVEAPRRILKHYDSVVQSSYQVAEVENMSQWYKSQSYNRH
jgi:hypothetical protein